jgi:hypothetical protein
MKYDVDYFIRKFTKIPDSRWCTYYYTVGKKHCALGHCGVSINSESTSQSKALADIFDYALVLDVASVNDGIERSFQQPNPRARILAALKAAKTKGKLSGL